MPRHARLRIAGLPLHTIQRGNNHAACFTGQADQRLYLALVAELAPRFSCAIHAYVLMTNHVHLLMTPAEATGPSAFMKHLGQRYVQYVNRNHGRSGSLWEGRFRSSIVDSDGYLLRCHRYIECNPVRAGMVASPADYPWSSYRANAFGERDPVITPHARYLALGENDAQRRANYLGLFQGEMTPAELSRIRDAANGGFALGSTGFVEQIERTLGRPARRKEVRTVPSRGTSGLSPV
jgi:putative transposase